MAQNSQNQQKSSLNITNLKERLFFVSPIVQGGLERELRLRDFENLGGLGQGAFGKVYQVKNKLNNQIYALKQISKQQIKKQEMVPQITNEIKLMYSIDHENVIKIYNHFEEEDFLYLVLEFASGGQLWKNLNRIGRFDEEAVKNIMKDIISAVEYLHSKNPPIIHRDIKPENLIFDCNKRVKLADFGWSNVFNDTKRKTYCGTLDYLAPEMILNQGHDQSLDLWSLGVLIFELLSGKSPFTPNIQTQDIKEKQKALQENILKVRLEFPSDFPRLPKDLTTKLLAKVPAQRPSIQQIKEHPWFNSSQQEEEQTIWQPQEEIINNPNYIPISSSQIQDNQGEFDASQIAQLANRISRDSIIPGTNNGSALQLAKQEQQNNNNNDNENSLNDSQMTTTSTVNQKQEQQIQQNNSQQQQQQQDQQVNQLKKKVIELQALQNQKDKEIHNLKMQIDSTGEGQESLRRLQLLEEEKQSQKKENEELWQQGREKDRKIQQLELEIEKVKDQKKMIDRYKMEKNALSTKISKLQEELQQSEQKAADIKTSKDKEIVKLEMKITEMQMNDMHGRNSELIGGNSIREIQILIEELNKKFESSKEVLEKVEIDQNHVQNLEKDNLKLRLERDNEISEAKLKIQEQMEEEIDRIREQGRNELDKYKQKYEEISQEFQNFREQQNKNSINIKLREEEYQSLKNQIEIQNNIIKDIRQEQDENLKLRVMLEEQSKQQIMVIKDYEYNINKYKQKSQQQQ